MFWYRTAFRAAFVVFVVMVCSVQGNAEQMIEDFEWAVDASLTLEKHGWHIVALGPPEQIPQAFTEQPVFGENIAVTRFAPGEVPGLDPQRCRDGPAEPPRELLECPLSHQ